MFMKLQYINKLNIIFRSISNNKFVYNFAMDKAYLRILDDHTTFNITFQYKDPEIKLDRQFNFTRQLNETVDSFLGRVNTNVGKVFLKKIKKRKDGVVLNPDMQVQSTLTEDGTLINGETICSDLFIENRRIILKLLQAEYVISINQPFIDKIGLPNSILANFPIYSTKFDSVFTEKDLSLFEWFKSIDKVNWEHVGSEYIYYPSNKDIGCFLKLKCTPKNELHEGPAIETISEVMVEAGPGICPFERRHAFTKEICKNGIFRVVTYNILADLYCDMEYTRTTLHPYCPPYALAMDYRKQLILKELLGYNADIICLQEVDRKKYTYDLEPIFKTMKFGSEFTLKGNVGEGVACFYNHNKFSLLETKSVTLSEIVNTAEILKPIWDCINVNDQLRERFIERKTVLQIIVLKCKETENIILVANTHLYSNPDADHIRLLQGSICIKYIEDLLQQIKEKHQENISTIFCGDFNSVPECGIYKLFTTGSVFSDCIDWKSNEIEAVQNLNVEQSLQLQSACGTPKYTNFTTGFADCLDYIFIDTTRLRVTQVIPLPSLEEIEAHTALPSIVFPSDHISLVADLQFIERDGK